MVFGCWYLVVGCWYLVLLPGNAAGTVTGYSLVKSEK